MPFGLSVGFASKRENYNQKVKKGTKLTLKKLVIALSGPLTNLMFVVIFLLFPIPFLGVDRELVIYANILIGIFNLIPIYPLDGGRIVKCILHIFLGRKEAYDYTNKISNITITFLTAASSIAILYWKNVAILIILGYLWYLVVIENKKYKNKKEIYKRIKQMKKKEENSIVTIQS